MPKITRSGGILCIGANHAQAVENFRNTATGQNVMFYASESGVAYASTSGTDLYNPNGNGELLSEVPELVEQADFASESSSEDVRAHYTICLDGCGSHIISDSAKSLSSCPSCSCNLTEITDERIQAYLTDEAAEQSSVSHTGLVALGTTAEEAQSNFVAALSGADVNSVSSAAGDFNAHGEAVKFDPYTGVAVTGQAPVEGFDSVSAVKQDGDNIEAHIYSCSASCAHPFTVSSDDEPVFCAHCSSPLLDSVSGVDDDEGDTDLDIDEDDLDLDEEDDEDVDSESSAEDDDIDEEEDDFDESDLDEDDDEEDDLDEDDLEEDDLDEDEEDYDDEGFDSESNSGPVRSLSLSDDDAIDDSDLDLDEEELEEDDLDLDDEDEDDFDSVSTDADDENEDDLFLDDEDLDEVENDEDLSADELDSESKAVVSRTFDSLSAVKAANEHLDPTLVSLSRAQHGLVHTVHMFYDGQPVARATFNSVSNAIGEENARQNFEKPAYTRAVEVSLRNNGVEATCKDFGFEPHKVEMPVEALLVADADQRINESTTQVTQTIAESTSAHAERLVAALSTAMLGNTKGFWQNTNNPIVESLCSALNAAGIKDVRHLVERAFIAHGKDFLSQSMDRANKLMAMSEIAQNEVAESVSNAAGVVKTEQVEQVQNVNNVEQTSGNAALDLLNAHNEAPASVQSHSSAQVGTFAERAARALRMG